MKMDELKEDQRLAKRAIMEKLGEDDQFLLLSTKLKHGLQSLESSDYSISGASVVRFATDEVVAFQISTILNEDEDVSRLLQQMNDEMRPDCVRAWTMKEHLAYIESALPTIENLPDEVRDALENLMRAIKAVDDDDIITED